MDITLTRILSLLPTDDTGKYLRGSKAEFARSIGYGSGDIVSMWENGTSTSYFKKLHQIAAQYNVSVEWLRGETDIKNPPSADAERKLNEEIISRLVSLSPEELEKVDAFVQGLLASH
jgi:transcriptional regulator with XRE-family HTH domain